MESDPKFLQFMEKPAASGSENAPHSSITTASLLGGQPRNPSLLQQLIEPSSSLSSASGPGSTELQLPPLARPPWIAPPPVPFPSLPQDLTEMPDAEEITLEFVLKMGHVYRCWIREAEDAVNGAYPWGCRLHPCRVMKDLVQHATDCTAGNHCPVENCALTKGIVSHWETCTFDWCWVCQELNSDRYYAGHENVHAAGEPVSDASWTTQIESIVVNLVVKEENVDTDTRDDWNPPMAERSADREQLEEHRAGVKVSRTGCDICQPTQSDKTLYRPKVVAAKRWHAEMAVSDDAGSSAASLRSDTICKLVEALIPYGGPPNLKDPPTAYARKVEAEIYEQSKSQKDYKQFITEEIQIIQEERAEKRRLELRQMLLSSRLTAPAVLAKGTSGTYFDSKTTTNTGTSVGVSDIVIPVSSSGPAVCDGTTCIASKLNCATAIVFFVSGSLACALFFLICVVGML